jgi:hypothetical protein
MMPNDGTPRRRPVPLAARVVGALAYALTVSVLCSLIAMVFFGARFVILHFLSVDCGP